MLAREIARSILDGFDKHYRLFREISAAAKGRFERSDWAGVRDASQRRIQFYDQRVREACSVIVERFPTASTDESLWPLIKQAYIGLLYDHLQPECAETFFNSVACRVLHRRYYHNQYIFWRPAVSTEHLRGSQPAYRAYYDQRGSLVSTLRRAIAGYELDGVWEDLDRDLAHLERAVRDHFRGTWRTQANFQIQVLSSLFYRNKAAYLVGRALNGDQQIPFVVPILKSAKDELFLDALLLSPVDIGRLFSLARAYFMVDAEVPSAYVTFLSSLLPRRSRAELYTMLGLQKQGKTLFYRDLFEHLAHSDDRFVLAQGVKGMVMIVFTLPSFPYVFKVVRDWFPPPKDTDREKVKEKYLLVKMHDRVGRLADTLEYSDVAFPLDRFDPSVVEELRTLAPSITEIDGDRLVIEHLYIERRMVPLDIYLKGADEAKARDAIRDMGNAIRELADANIFPGDLLLKNFGVTRYGRVVFYDYDEIGYLTEHRFRRLPQVKDDDDDMWGDGRSEPSFYVGPHDIFPEQFPTFMFSEPWQRAQFMELHGELADARFWIERQERCRAGVQGDIFPYPGTTRFSARYGGRPVTLRP